MSAEFGPLLRAAMQDQGLSQGKVAALVGMYDGDRYLDATQVRLLMNGTRKPTRGLVQRLIEVLDLDPAEAWAAAGLLPPGTTADMLRRLHLVGVREEKVIGWYSIPAGQRLPEVPVPADLDELVRRNRRDRRQRNRRARRLRSPVLALVGKPAA